MEYKIKAFGIAREIMGGKEIAWVMEGATVGDLRKSLVANHPALADLRSLFIAVNNAYAPDGQIIASTDEIAVIPPVSGG